jgi:hypothetical protein
MMTLVYIAAGISAIGWAWLIYCTLTVPEDDEELEVPTKGGFIYELLWFLNLSTMYNFGNDTNKLRC